MKLTDAYNVSLCKNGVLGGMLYLKDGEMIYCTNKLTVPENIRRLHLPYGEILSVRKAPLHTVEVALKKGESYRFLVFRRKGFLQNIHTRVCF